MAPDAVLAALAQAWEPEIHVAAPSSNGLDQALIDCVKQSIASRTEPFESLVLRVQRELITQVLKQFEGAQERAAEFLGVTPVGLSQKLRELGLQ
jgi:DNA-binding NtrC family response regulator